MLPWVEKYRPVILEDIVGNENIVKQFKIISQNGNMPHMILSGSPGTGKTTSIICLAKMLLKNEFINAFLELNASDERGIEVIRNKITLFCKKKITLPEGSHKIIFLDEVDSMTSTAQQALRRIIEIHATTTRFVMACNTSSKIIEAIQSRCSVIRFNKLDDESIKKRLIVICEKEDVSYTDDGLNALILNTDGDLRRSINNLQAIATTYKEVSEDTVKKVIDKPDNLIIDKMIHNCLEGNFNEAHHILNMLIEDGYASLDIVQTLFTIVKDLDIEYQKKLHILSCIGETQMHLINGGDSYLQLLALISRMML
jgi:replication factor C subunit 2/4